VVLLRGRIDERSYDGYYAEESLDEVFYENLGRSLDVGSSDGHDMSRENCFDEESLDICYS
jgi:hypothetical protein